MPELPDYIQPVADATPQTLENVRKKVAEARDLHFQAANLEERLKEANTALNKVLTKDLPEILDEAGVPKMELAAEGNMPAVEAKIDDFYRANIAASWDDERRQKAFNTLRDLGAESLIKAEITINFPVNKFAEAEELFEALRSKGLDVALSKSVHTGTLSAWLKDTIRGGTHVPLDDIGGHVGRIAKLKELKK